MDFSKEIMIKFRNSFPRWPNFLKTELDQLLVFLAEVDFRRIGDKNNSRWITVT